MMLRIISAYYDNKNITDILNDNIYNNSLMLFVSNDLFGDPNPGKIKILTVLYELDGKKIEQKYKENDFCIINIQKINIEFIIPTYNRVNELYSMLSSLVAQTNDNWSATIVVDDFENDLVKNIVSRFDTNKIKYIFTNVRYHNWGHTPREIGKQQSNGDYIIMTGDDNYYVPSFVDEFINSILCNNKPGMVYCDMIHNEHSYQHFNCNVDNGFIDMGAFATRKDLSQNLKLGTEYAADAHYVMDFIKKYPYEKIVKINKILFVHN